MISLHNPTLIVVALLTLLVSANVWVLCLLHARIKANRLGLQKLDQLLRALSVEQARISKGAMGVGRRLIHAEKRLKTLAERHAVADKMRLDDQGYLQAKKLMREGVKISEVMNTCGVSRTEAQLLKLMGSESLEATS